MITLAIGGTEDPPVDYISIVKKVHVSGMTNLKPGRVMEFIYKECRLIA